MEACIQKVHRIEFVEEVDGVITWLCVPCGVQYDEYQDCNAGR